ncbi:MAG: hypothetical protein ABSG53_28085 [Thermoguttaceae bacterium]
MKVTTNVRCGGRQLNHNQTLKAASGMPVKTSVKSGGAYGAPGYLSPNVNHNQTLKA